MVIIVNYEPYVYIIYGQVSKKKSISIKSRFGTWKVEQLEKIIGGTSKNDVRVGLC